MSTPPLLHERKPIRVFVLDDQCLYRAGVRSWLGRTEDIEVVGEAGSSEEALGQIEGCDPDVVLISLDLDNEDALELIPRLGKATPASKWLVVASDDAARGPRARTAILCGGRGVIKRKTSGESLVLAIRAVADGQSSGEGHLLPEPGPEGAGSTAKLTRRERELIGLLAEGLRNDQIAMRLGVAAKTVRNHLSAIYEKVGVNDRLSLLVYGYHHGLARRPG